MVEREKIKQNETAKHKLREKREEERTEETINACCKFVRLLH